MNAAPPVESQETPPPTKPSEKLYQIGTLTYTKRGLAAVFFWIFWGGFVLTMMETLPPSLLPILLKKHGASDKEIAIIVTTILSVLTAIINPVLSYKSDRTRTRFGRRIPYLLAATPLVAITIALVPFSPDITEAALKVPLLEKILHAFPVAPVILVFGIIVTLFQVFNMGITSVYYYLFRDVIPLDFLGRFLSLFRVVSYLGLFTFNYWLLGKADAYMKEIFVGVSLLYAVGFLLMCWRVKEGSYLPVEATEKTTGGLKQAIRNFTVQSFGAPIYNWIYITRALVTTIFITIIPFNIFFWRDQLHLSLDQVGKLTAWPWLFCIPLAYPFGILIDRWGSMRVMPMTLWAIIVTNTLAFFFIHDGTTLLIFGSMPVIAQFLFMIAQMVWLNRLFHQERIGQLSSANAIICAIVGALAGPLCAQSLTWLHDYRYVYLWPVGLTLLGVLSLHKVKSHWTALGGHEHYHPPLPSAPDSVGNVERGMEETAARP